MQKQRQNAKQFFQYIHSIGIYNYLGSLYIVILLYYIITHKIYINVTPHLPYSFFVCGTNRCAAHRAHVYSLYARKSRNSTVSSGLRIIIPVRVSLYIVNWAVLYM